MHISNVDLYRDLLKEKAGIVLGADKAYLLESRLTPVAQKWQFKSIDVMSMALRGVAEPDLIKDVVEAMAVSETFFFRDVKPFLTLRDDILPSLTKKKKIRIWCAGAASGQEPYSIAMLLKDKGCTADIIGTDISTTILDDARRGDYSQADVQRGLPVQMLMKYFQQKGTSWILKDDIKKMVTFKYFNLLDSMGQMGTFDLIFCRHVLCHFEDKTRTDVLMRLSLQLADGGYLFLGKGETTDILPAADGKPGVFVKS